MAYINLVRYTDTSLTINIAGLSNTPSYYDSVYVNCNGETKGTTTFYGSVGNAYSAGIEFTGLTPGASYYCGATIYYRGTSQTFYDTFTTSDTTPPVINYFEATNFNGGIRVGVTASDTGGVNSILYRVSAPSVIQPSEENFNYPKTVSASDNYFTYMNDGNGNPFVNGSTYWFQATAIDNSGNISEKRYVACVFVQAKPTLWAWTQTELNAFNKVDGYKVSSVTWQRWNAFVEKVKEFDKWKNGANAGAYYLDDALMNTDSKVLTAYRFNVVREAIGGMNSNGSGISKQYSGMPVIGSYFITLASRLNGITVNYSLGSFEDLYNIEFLHEMALIENKIRDLEN